MEPMTRHSLLLRLRNPEDRQAWSEFAAVYEPLVYRLARGRGLQDADARDVCQEVLSAVAAAIERWDPNPDKGSFRGWLFRIARNLTIDALAHERKPGRGTGASSVQALLAEHPQREDPAAREYDVEFRRNAFRWAAGEVRDEFSATTWSAFWMTGVEQRTPLEAAAELGLSLGAVYVARSRVLARLREKVEGLTLDSGLVWGGESDDAALASL